MPIDYTVPTLSWQEPMPILPGRRLGPYGILSAIGAGGMGKVYKARDTRLDRTVAIKVLPVHLADRPAENIGFLLDCDATHSIQESSDLYEIRTGYSS